MADAQRLRHAIDTGRTGEKVAYPDPAAAPLGTDDEASGNSPQRPFAPVSHGDQPMPHDASVGQHYEPVGTEDNRAPADDPPSWRMWGIIALSLLVLGGVAAGLST